jgi:uncharacterized repeat protein (TIGR01451 family)
MKRGMLLLVSSVLAISVMVAGCGPCAAPKPKAAEPKAAAPAPAMVVSPCAVSGQSKAAGQYPGAGEIKLEKFTPEFVYLNQEYVYRIEATNTGSAPLTNVVVSDTIPANVKVSSSDPAAQMAGTTAKWALGTVNPGEKKVITVKAVPTGAATISGCASVTYDKSLCAEIKVLEPKVAVVVSAPKEVSLCDSIPVSYVVTNSGNAELCGLTLTGSMPAGAKVVSADQKNTFDMANVAAGQSGKAATMVKVDKPGTYTFGADVAASGGAKAQAAPVTVSVVQCALKVETSAPEVRYIGRPAQVDLKVTNTGNGAAKNAVVTAATKGGTLTGASEGGTVAAGKATWKIAALKPGESKTLSVTLGSAAAGDVAIDASASADCCPPANAAAKVAYKGVAGILLEMVDVTDPIEVGAQETYIITVTNQGTAVDKNVKMICKLDGNMEYVSSSGTTVGAAKEGGVIEFAPVALLEPKAKVSWKVIVKATKEADARFYTEITSDMLTTPVTKTESTHFYK